MVVARQWRGGCVESVHPFSVFAVRDGAVVFAEGPDVETAFRSASKPMQLAVSLAHLGDPGGLRAEMLAVGAASHSAEPKHLAVVGQILERFGQSPADLRCGAHPPVHAPSAEAILRAGGSFTDLHNNCSGKHAFMLAAAAAEGWDLDYRAPEHPLQRHMRERMQAWMDHAPSVAVDGCGVPTFVQPLSRAARAWEAVAVAMDREGDDPWQRRLHRVGWAMAEHVDLTSGTGRLEIDLVRHASEPLAVKIGAAGLFCIARPLTRTAIAVKVHSGATEALPVAVEWALDRIAPGLFARPEPWERALVRNVVGREVGHWDVSG
jgi:L-asparaginase II